MTVDVDVGSFFLQYGQPGLFVGAGIILFRYLLTRHDQLAKENLEDLKRQVASWTRRALRAELVVRAYQRAGHPIPAREVEEEVQLAEGVEGLFKDAGGG